jgi:hypothetical protein
MLILDFFLALWTIYLSMLRLFTPALITLEKELILACQGIRNNCKINLSGYKVKTIKPITWYCYSQSLVR